MLSMTFKSKFYDSSKTMYRNAKTTTKETFKRNSHTTRISEMEKVTDFASTGRVSPPPSFKKNNKQKNKTHNTTTKKTSHQEQCQKSPGPPTISFRSHVSIPDRGALAHTQAPLQMYNAAMGLSTVNSPNNCIYK